MTVDALIKVVIKDAECWVDSCKGRKCDLENRSIASRFFWILVGLVFIFFAIISGVAAFVLTFCPGDVGVNEKAIEYSSIIGIFLFVFTAFLVTASVSMISGFYQRIRKLYGPRSMQIASAFFILLAIAGSVAGRGSWGQRIIVITSYVALGVSGFLRANRILEKRKSENLSNPDDN